MFKDPSPHPGQTEHMRGVRPGQETEVGEIG